MYEGGGAEGVGGISEVKRRAQMLMSCMLAKNVRALSEEASA